jgi:hypothetical protein
MVQEFSVTFEDDGVGSMLKIFNQKSQIIIKKSAITLCY